MAVILATKTLAAIEAAIASDQGAAFRQNQQKVFPHMGDAYAGASKNPFRNHMGASLIGNECARAVWYSWRWFTRPAFSGRILRLFNRGHLEEARFVAMLLTIGVQVYQQDANGKQFRISHFGGHFGGSGDGVGIGIPDLPLDLAALLEFKTHSSKSFAALVKDGVKFAKPVHYTQMQTYMRKMGLTVALYGAVNKDTDELWFEIVVLDTLHADQYLDRAVQLIQMPQPPRKLNSSPGYYICKNCDHRQVCHLNVEPERNCRTCFYSRAREDGRWYCAEPTADAAFGDNPELSVDDQLAGCDNYMKI
jgi:hypothetical protein